MSNMLLLALADYLSQLAKLIREQTGGAEGQVIKVLPVQITPEPSQVVMEIPDVFAIADTTYIKVLDYAVPKGYKVYLNELTIAPDTECKTYGRFLIIVGSAKQQDKRLMSALTLSWGWLTLEEGATIQVLVKTTDKTHTVGGNVAMNGRQVRVT